jgi:hypothetical protein
LAANSDERWAVALAHQKAVRSALYWAALKDERLAADLERQRAAKWVVQLDLTMADRWE